MGQYRGRRFNRLISPKLNRSKPKVVPVSFGIDKPGEDGVVFSRVFPAMGLLRNITLSFDCDIDEEAKFKLVLTHGAALHTMEGLMKSKITNSVMLQDKPMAVRVSPGDSIEVSTEANVRNIKVAFLYLTKGMSYAGEG